MVMTTKKARMRRLVAAATEPRRPPEATPCDESFGIEYAAHETFNIVVGSDDCYQGNYLSIYRVTLFSDTRLITPGLSPTPFSTRAHQTSEAIARLTDMVAGSRQ